MKRTGTVSLFAIIILILVLSGCNKLDKNITIKLPPFTPQTVVECYLEQDSTLAASVTHTQDYFGTFRLPFDQHAHVMITYNNTTDSLSLNLLPDFKNQKYFNYKLNKTIPLQAGTTYSIKVIDSAGNISTGQTQWLPPVKIDTIEWNTQKGNDTAVDMTISLTDNASTTDFYRLRVDYISHYPSSPDYYMDDGLQNGQKITVNTDYLYNIGDTVDVYLYHITRDYYNFLNSADAASSANGDPFAQPAAIKTNIQNGTGIFTVLSYDKRRVIFKK